MVGTPVFDGYLRAHGVEPITEGEHFVSPCGVCACEQRYRRAGFTAADMALQQQCGEAFAVYLDAQTEESWRVYDEARARYGVRIDEVGREMHGAHYDGAHAAMRAAMDEYFLQAEVAAAMDAWQAAMRKPDPVRPTEESGQIAHS
jgi:hypothetical protein